MRLGSLFTGYGGLDLAVENVLDDPELVFVADNDAAAAAVLAARFDAPNLGDVTRLDWTRVPPVDVLTGGTPCQDISHAGHRAGMRAGTRSNLWVAMREAIAALRPRLVVWENVKGATSAHADSDLELCPRCMGATWTDQPRLRALGRVLGDLADLGFDAAWIDRRATDVGAPHIRARIFLLAWPEDDPPGWIGDPADLLDRRRGVVRPVDEATLGTPAASIWRGSGPPGSPSHAARLDRSYLDAQVVDLADQDDDVDLLPTPVVNDMGEGKSVEWWDEWAPRQTAADGTRAVHGRSLAIETIRLLPTPGAYDGDRGGAVSVAQRKAGNHAVNLQDAVKDETYRFGRYAAAVARWERVLGRRAPNPTETSPLGNVRLAPPFAEWMMGIPSGWVTDPELELGRRHQLRLIGNGVVPLQATDALAELLAIVIASTERGSASWPYRGSAST